MNNWKAAFAVCLIFAGGVITGAFIATKARPVWSQAPPAASKSPTPQARLELFRRMAGQLDLTPEQTTKVNTIIEGGRERIKTAFQGIMPSVRTELVKVRQEIKAVLTPDQNDRFEAQIKARMPVWAQKYNSVEPAKPESKPSL